MPTLLYILLLAAIVIVIPFVYRISVLIGQRVGTLAIEYRENKEKFSHLKKKKK